MKKVSKIHKMRTMLNDTWKAEKGMIFIDSYKYYLNYYLKEVNGPNKDKPSDVKQVYIEASNSQSTRQIIGDLYPRRSGAGEQKYASPPASEHLC